jgi:hypothetical protein
MFKSTWFLSVFGKGRVSLINLPEPLSDALSDPELKAIVVLFSIPSLKKFLTLSGLASQGLNVPNSGWFGIQLSQCLTKVPSNLGPQDSSAA